MRLMDKFNCIPKCVAILSVLSGVYQTLTIFDSMGGLLGVFPSIKIMNIIQAPH